MNTMYNIIFLIVWLGLFIRAEASDIMPDKTVQMQIHETAIRVGSSTNEEEALVAIQELDRDCPDKIFLIQQVMAYLRFSATNEECGWGGIGILHFLDVDKITKVKAAMPLLSDADMEWQKMAVGILNTVDKDRGRDEGVDFSPYETIMREASPQQPPGELIRYMYKRNPRAAITSVARVYSQEVLESEIIVNTKRGVKESVDYFAGRPEWWAHLYVASVLEKDPLLRTPELMDMLVKDSHPIVQEKVSKLIEEMEPKPEALPTLE